MGFLLGKKQNQKPAYTGLQLNTAVGTLPIPLLWGRQKMTGNLIWYNGFVAYQKDAERRQRRRQVRICSAAAGRRRPTTAPTSSSRCARGRSTTSASPGRIRGFTPPGISTCS